MPPKRKTVTKDSEEAAPSSTSAAPSSKRSKPTPATVETNESNDNDSSNPTTKTLFYLECKQGGSDKFYEVSLVGTSVLSRYGRIGTLGASVIKDFPSVTECNVFVENLMEEKLKKGYKVKLQPSAAADAPPTASKARVILKASPPSEELSKNPSTTERHYFECTTGGSSKFYEVVVSADSVESRYGRIGSAGAKTRKQFKTTSELRDYVSSLLEEKVNKGYVIVLQDMAEMEPVAEKESTADEAEELETVLDDDEETAESGSESVTSSNPSTSKVYYMECIEGSSSKFYEVVVEGCSAVLRYGRIGADGNPSTKSFPSPEEATAFALKTVGEKTKKGYKVISADPPKVSNTASSSNAKVSTVDIASSAMTVNFEDCLDANAELENGKTILFPGSGKMPYKVKKFVGGYSCTCKGWIFQIKPKGIQAASCKHLKQIRGEDAEAERCGSSVAPSGATTSSSSNGRKNTTIAGKVSLAQQWKEGQQCQGFLMSEKLDGMRAYWNNGKLWSRNGNEIFAPEWFIAGLPETDDLDGELFLGRQRFNDCMSIARRSDASEEWKQLRYVVFDCPTATGGIGERLKKAESLLKGSGNVYVVVHPHTVCQGEEELLEKLAEIEKVGGEGLMLRNPTAKHRGGRNSDLLKVKSFHDDEALIVAYEEGKGKYDGMVGSLICINRQGTRFKVGSGLSDDLRGYRSAPKIGSVITFKYFELTPDGVPRFPTYMRVRPDVDASVFPKNK